MYKAVVFEILWWCYRDRAIGEHKGAQIEIHTYNDVRYMTDKINLD